MKLEKYVQIEHILNKDRFEGIGLKVQMKAINWTNNSVDGTLNVTKALFVLKFGGELTHSGLNQAISFG